MRCTPLHLVCFILDIEVSDELYHRSGFEWKRFLALKLNERKIYVAVESKFTKKEK